MSWFSSLFDSGPSSNEINAEAAARQEQLRVEAEVRAEQQRQLDAALAANAPTDAERQLQELMTRQQTQQLTDEQTRSGLRSQAMQGVNSVFAPEFERSYIPNTYDDSYINSAFTGQRAKADEYLSNLLKRNVINQTGYAGGQAAIGDQEAGVRSQLENLGSRLLEAQRGKLTDVGNRARSAASTVDIGQTFDPNIYSSELQSTAGDIGRTFGDQFNSSIPAGLFDLTTLGQKAGAAQGAQNLAFDPEAIAGDIAPADEETAPLTPQKKRSSTVF